MMLGYGYKIETCFHVIAKLKRPRSFVKHQYNRVACTRCLHLSVVNDFTKISFPMFAANIKLSYLQRRNWLFPITENNVKFVVGTLDAREKIVLMEHMLKLMSDPCFIIRKQSTNPNSRKSALDFLDIVDLTLKEQTQKLKTVDNVTKLFKHANDEPTQKQLFYLSLHAGLPYFIFGYMDNFFMVIFGDIVDSFLGPLGYSSLTSAALGNTLSDVLSVILSVYTEKVIHYSSGFAKVDISEAMLGSLLVKSVIDISKPLYVAVGTLLGMWPLYFM